jgi:hypothetical protein
MTSWNLELLLTLFLLKLLKVAEVAAKDRFAFFLNQLRRIILDKWTKMTPEVHERVLSLVTSMICLSGSCDPDALDAVLLALMRHIAVGNVCQANIWLAAAVLDLFLAQLQWLKSRASIIPFAVYTFLSVLNDHTRVDLLPLRDREAHLCATLIRERVRHNSRFCAFLLTKSFYSLNQ